MKKFIILALIIIIFVTIGYLFGNRDEQDEESPEEQRVEQERIRNRTIPTLTFEEIPETETIEINDVEVDNFFTNIESEVTENNSYVEIEETEDYAISYINKYNLFTIVVLESPFEEKRIEAEQQFLRDLDITQEEACQLDVDVTTPNFANPEESGKIYGLSFCE